MLKKNKFFIKVVSMALALVMIVGMCAGCGKEGDSLDAQNDKEAIVEEANAEDKDVEANAEDKDEQGRTIISVGGWPSKEGDSLDAQNEKKARFEEANPDVVIEPDMWTFDRKTFYAKAAGGQLPMVYNAGVTEMAEIIGSGYSADLTEVLKKRGYEGKFNPAVLDIVSEDGKIYAFPYACNVMGLMFNAELYKEAGLIDENDMPMQPETWDDVVEYAKKIKEATGKPGFVMPTANGSGGWLFSCLAWSFGVDFMEKDADGKWKATFDSPEAAEALQFVKDMKWVHDILPANTLIDGAEWQKIFGSGGAGITFGAGEYPAKASQKYGISPENIGMLAMVKGPKRHVTLLSGDVYCVSAGATEDQIDAAIRWIETSYNYNATDEVKTNLVKSHEIWKENNQIIGIKAMSIWNNDTEIVKYQREISDQYCNGNPNYLKPYNDFAMNCQIEIQAEEPVCCQELYQILDSCLQEVLTNPDADCAEVMRNANADFQTNYLDIIEY